MFQVLDAMASKEKKKNFSPQIKNKFSNMKLNKENHTHMLTVYQYH